MERGLLKGIVRAVLDEGGLVIECDKGLYLG